MRATALFMAAYWRWASRLAAARWAKSRSAAPSRPRSTPLEDYLIYSLTDGSGSPLGKVLVTATAGGGYDADREYWYLSSNLSNGSAVTFSGGSSQDWSTTPSGLGTLSFKTVRTPTWTSGTSTGSMLVYSSALTGEYDAINWG